MTSLKNARGQLMAPLVLFLFLCGIFLVMYLAWCRAVYWRMRMDLAAEAVALSAARAQAEMLNNVATLQSAENIFLQRARVFGGDIAHVQVTARNSLRAANEALNGAVHGFNGYVVAVAQRVAKANGSDKPAVSWPKPDHRLEPVSVFVFYFARFWPVGEQTLDRAFYRRKWGPGNRLAQPDHALTWAVCRAGVVGIATARVWLDVPSSSLASNGGFPALGLPWYRDLGLQAFYPHFNARLAPTPPTTAVALRELAKRL